MKRSDNLDIITEMNEYMADAENCLLCGVYNIDGGFYKDSINRSYYCIYNMMCACLITVGFTEHSKHSTVIGKFRELLIKPGILTSALSDIIANLSEYRNNSDYQKGFRASKSEADECADKAKLFFETTKKYIGNWLKENNGE